MAGVKFSAFTTGATTANTLIVGYDSVAGTNNQYTLAQLKTGLAITTLYDGDGTLSSARTISMDGNNLTINYGTGSVFPSLDMGKVILYPNGENALNPPTTIKTSGNIYFTYGAPYYQGLVWTSFNTSQKAWYTSMYGGGGWSHYQGYSVIGPNFASITSGGALTAKLGVIGLHNDNTSYAFRVQNSDSTDIFHVSNDTTTTVEKNLVIKGQGYTELHDTTNTTLTVDWNNSNIQELTSLTGSLTFTASNPKAGATYILTLAQTGTVTATWTGVKWPAATAPTLSGAGKTDVITLICYDATGAGLYYGASTLNFTT
tara:strand:+ start:688 stop:1635 length:948 start_codon:yes stop_codon:yes gene_type:complete